MTDRRLFTLGAALALAGCLSLLGPRAHALNTRELGFGLADVFGPGSCGVCHGNQSAGVVGRYWPDGVGGSPAYVDDSPGGAGTHDNHVLAISQWLFQEDLATLVTDTGNGLSDTKQKAICAWCHPNPGGPRPGTTESSHTNNTFTPGVVDVHGDGRTAAGTSVFLYYDGLAAPRGARNDTDAVYAPATKSCNLANCHNEVGTPTTPFSWDAPPAWTTTNCDSAQCHQTSATSGAHNTHYAGTQKNYDCLECHVVPTSLRHGNGQVNLKFDNTGALEFVYGAGNGYYDLNADLVADNNFPASYDGAGAANGVCNSVYCHGGDDAAWGGTDTTPQWDNPATASCGDCHEHNNPTTGNHEAHVSAPYGPSFGAGICGGCHTGNGVTDPTHVNGTPDFANLDTTVTAVSLLGLTAPAGPPDATSTDRCNNCHSTAVAGGQTDSGTVLAKTNWSDDLYVLECETCHNTAGAAWSKAAGSAAVDPKVQAPSKEAFFATRGHGLPAASDYPWPDGGPGRAGAESVCTDCHAAAASHISHVLADTDRLAAAGNGLCNGCHDGAGGGPAATQVSTHANTSATMAGTYTRQRNAFELNCVECHDVHGTASIFMINGPNADGPLIAPRQYNGSNDTTTLLFNGTVSFTTETPATSTSAGVGYARAGAGDATKICQTCHTQTGHYQFNSDDGHLTSDCIDCHKHDFDDDFAANSQDGFMPAGCNSCHGFPPVAPSDVPLLGISGVNNCGELDVSSSDYKCENYAGGGGPHFRHVSALKAKLADSVDPVEICGPCHGDGAGSVDHGGAQGPGAWPIATRGLINIRVRATGNSWDGMTADPRSATYGGSAVNVTGTTPPGNDMDATDSRCAGVDCHGNPDPGDADEVLSWNLDVADDPGDAEDGLNKSRTCEGCHDETPSQWRVYDLGGGSATYTGSAPNAATNYYGPWSGYSRGGHGDAEIQNEDPFIDSGTGTTPIDCTACHSDAAAHFPEAAANLHRLVVVTLEDTSHSSSGLCNSCHNGSSYTGTGDNHHPSLRGTSANASRDIVVNAASQEVRQVPSSWDEVPPGSGHYEQDGYSAQNVSGNPDFEVDWWGGTRPPPVDANQSPPPQPSPFAVLPLLQFVGNQSGATNAVMCVTCHNPHGTDLYVFDPGGIGGSIPDNNMLRLRDEDNTLCNACH